MKITINNIETIKIDTIEKLEDSINLLIELINKFDDDYDMELENAIIIIYNIIDAAKSKIKIRNRFEKRVFDDLIVYFAKCNHSLKGLQDYYSEVYNLVDIKLWIKNEQQKSR